MTDPSFAPPASQLGTPQLGALNVAAYPTAGQGLALGLNGKIPSSMFAYTAYTPAWTSSGTAPALGNGTIVGSYLQIGKLVVGSVTLTFGSTTTFGSGTYSLTLPVVPAGALFTPVGTVGALDAGVATYIGSAQLTSGTFVQLTNLASPIGAYTNSVPFTFGNGDGIILNFSYEAA